MDQHGVKEAENKSQDSAAEQREGSMDQRAGYKAEEESAPAVGLLVKEVGSGEESSPAALLAHPCSLLQLLLRACVGCLGLHGYCSSSDDDRKPADAAAPDAAAAASDSSQEGEGGGKANADVLARVRAVRRPPPPSGLPREGSGGHGGVHH